MIAPTDKASKALMRAQFKAVREGLSVGERCAIDEAIARNVAALPEFAAADGVFTYLSFGAEVDTRERHSARVGGGENRVPAARCSEHARDALVCSGIFRRPCAQLLRRGRTP